MTYYGVFSRHEKLNFVSNSLSFNAKSSFLYKNSKRLKESKYVVLGSSMSLNNIDGLYLEKELNEKVINLASWGMKINDFEELLSFVNPESEIIINISFTDFGRAWIGKYSNFPIGDQNEILNKALNFRTFREQVVDIDKCTSTSSNKEYTCLNYDSTGSVMLDKENLVVSPRRWENDREPPTTSDIDYFIDKLNIFKGHKVYVFFSPERNKYKTKIKEKILSDLEVALKKRYTDVLFFNNYHLNYSDSEFADCYHLNDLGARKYSELIFNQINASKLNSFLEDSK